MPACDTQSYWLEVVVHVLYPRSGGSRCTLQLHQRDQEPFFSIDRVDQLVDDEVTALFKAL
jgi:hypothetical protein